MLFVVGEAVVGRTHISQLKRTTLVHILFSFKPPPPNPTSLLTVIWLEAEHCGVPGWAECATTSPTSNVAPYSTGCLKNTRDRQTWRSGTWRMEKKAERERERGRVTTLERLEGTNKGFFLVAILIDKHCSPRSVSPFTMLFNNHFFLSFSLPWKDYGGRSRPLEKWENMLQKRLRKEKRCCTKRKNKGGVGKLE